MPILIFVAVQHLSVEEWVKEYQAIVSSSAPIGPVFFLTGLVPFAIGAAVVAGGKESA